MRLNEYSKSELDEMYKNGRIGKCVVCGLYEEVEYKFPFHNVIKCKECRKLGRKAKPKMTQYDYLRKENK